jgi:branched-chain amino acid transport system permease protein
MGVPTARYKLLAFVLGALFASLAGWLFAHDQRSVNPSPFGLPMGIQYLFMTVLGGAGYVAGAFVGAAVVVVAQDRLQDVLPALLGTSGPVELIVFGVVLVALLQGAPEGLWSLVARHAAPRRRRQRAGDEAATRLPSSAMPPAGELLLRVAGVRKAFDGLVAIAGVDFTVQAGEIVGLIGPNGAGKSTLFDLVTGMVPLTAGRIEFRGRRVDGLPARAIASRGLARTFQHVRLVSNLSVLENVALGAHRRGRAGVVRAMLRLERAEERRLFAEAWRQLERVGLEAWAESPAGHLALGPQRLVEIARALCSGPSLLLLDEPAAGLRLQEKQALAEVLVQLRAQGMTLLLVEHDMAFVMTLANRLVVLESGTKLADGPPESVRADPAVRAAYLGVAH